MFKYFVAKLNEFDTLVLKNTCCLPLTNWAVSWENRILAYAKTKAQIGCAVTAQLISAFVFSTPLVQFLFYLYPKFPAASFLLRLYSPVRVGPGRKSRRPGFSRCGSIDLFAWRDSVKQLKRNEDFSSICGVFPSICGVSLWHPGAWFQSQCFATLLA